MPETMFVLPVRAGRRCPTPFAKYAVSPAEPLELPAEEIGATAIAGSTSGHRPSCAETRRAPHDAAVPAAFVALFFVFPLPRFSGVA